MALICGLFAEKLIKSKFVGYIVGCVTGGCFQIVGYTLAKLIMYDKAYALTTLPELIMQPLFDSFVADDPCVYPVMDFAKAYDIPVFIHCGHPPYSLPWSIALLAERYPDVRVTMIHMGHGHGVYIDASIKMAKRYDNLYLEMSGMPMGSKIKEAYETVGSDRIMFGIDSPFHHPTVEIQKVLSCGLDEAAQQDVFYNNAKKLLRL